MVKETFREFWRATKRYPVPLIIAMVSLGLFYALGDVAAPYVVSRVIGLMATMNQHHLSWADFTPLLQLFIIIEVGFFLGGRIGTRAYIYLQASVMRDLENLCLRALERHSYDFFANEFTGALVTRANRFVNAYLRITDTITFELGELLIQLILAITIIMIYTPLIGLIFMVWVIFYTASLIYLTKLKLPYSRAAAAADSAVTGRLADTITNILTVKIFSRTDTEQRQFEVYTQERFKKRKRSWDISENIRIYKHLVQGVLQFSILWLSVKMVLDSKLDIGTAVLIQFYLRQLLTSIWNVSRVLERSEEALGEAAEMTEILLRPVDVTDPPRPEKSLIKRGSILFTEMSFQYESQTASSAEPLFRNFNLQVEPGQKVGLVGPSGGGKTTLVKLLLRFMDINDGKILIDGQNIAHVRQDDLRRHIAYVPQEPLLFHRSIFQNIHYGNPEANQDQVYEAARLAHATEFIEGLPKGYDTLVGERGIKLSGGEKQRIAIARAMLKPAPILLLDEATSALDSKSEKFIQEALGELMKHRTTIVIAHRLSTIRKLDRILVLSHGQIVEQGSHAELLDQNGVYAELWGHQSGDFLPDE